MVMNKKRPAGEYPVLLIHDGEHGVRYILAMNNEEEELAWLAMFTALHVWDDCYCYDDLDFDERNWFDLARTGNTTAAKLLLQTRGNYEYERVYTECIDTPFSMLKHFLPEDGS